LISSATSNENYNYTNLINYSGNNEKKTGLFPIHTPSRESVQKISQEIKKLYTDPLDIPNFYSIVQLPGHTVLFFRALADGYFRKEKENITDAKLKLCKTSVNATYSIATIANALTVCRELSSFGKSFPFLGLAAAVVSGGLEIKNIGRQIAFIAHCKSALNKLEKEPENLEAYNFLERFLSNSSEANKLHMNRLAQRVKPWYAEKFTIELPQALENKDTKKAYELLKNANIQAQKKTVQHILSFLCNVLIFTACACLIAGTPYIFPFILFGGIFILCSANYIFGKGTDQIGWKFSPEYCIPFWKNTHTS
jgi:hypothetical protein